VFKLNTGFGLKGSKMTKESIWDTPITPPVQEEPKPEEKNLSQIMADIPDSPDQSQIETWKQQHGEVFCSGFSPLEMYIFRPLTRVEFVQMQTVMQSPDNQLTQLEIEEQIVQRCLLWGSNDGMLSLQTKAGSLTTLHEQILQNSNFINPAMASALVMKL